MCIPKSPCEILIKDFYWERWSFPGGSDSKEGLLEKRMATHSSILAWRTHGQRSLVGYSPWGYRVRYDWETNTSNFTLKISDEVLKIYIWTLNQQSKQEMSEKDCIPGSKGHFFFFFTKLLAFSCCSILLKSEIQYFNQSLALTLIPLMSLFHPRCPAKH